MKVSELVEKVNVENKDSLDTKTEIGSLFDRMLDGKSFNNNIRAMSVEAKKVGNKMNVKVEGKLFVTFDNTGTGKLIIRLLEDADYKMFKHVLEPILEAINKLYETKVDIKFPKVFNKNTKFYVTSEQISGLPATLGQRIVFTNLNQGRFTIK